MREKENERNQEEELIDLIEILTDYFRIFRRMWAWILILTIVCSSIFYVRARLNYVPYYTASVTFTVNIQSENQGVNDTSSSAYFDNAAAEQMATTFPYILTSGVLRRKVAEDMGTGTVPGSIRASVTENTNLFTISVTDTDAQRAYETLQSVIENYPSVSEVIVGKTNMHLLDETGVPKSADNPKVFWKSAVKGAILGLMLGMFWCLILVVTRRTIRKDSDIRKWMNTKCLGTVPMISLKKRTKKSSNPRLTLLEPNTEEILQEPIRMIRNKVEYHARKYNCKTFLITSALAGEGKSTIAVNLALSLVQDGKKVALIDCDLRHPSDRKILGLDAGIGLSEVLEKEAKPSEAMINVTELGLDKNTPLLLLLGGKSLKDGSEYLNSVRMKSIIENMKKWADFVILDSAPAGLLTDAVVLAQYADGAIVVVRKDYAKVDHIMDGLEHLSESHIQIVGGILNGV